MNDIDLMFTRLRGYSGRGHRSKAYLGFIRDKNCLLCDAPGPSDPHHVFGSFGPRKTSDYHCVPLCRPCHTLAEAKPLSHRDDFIAWIVINLTEWVSK